MWQTCCLLQQHRLTESFLVPSSWYKIHLSPKNVVSDPPCCKIDGLLKGLFPVLCHPPSVHPVVSLWLFPQCQCSASFSPACGFFFHVLTCTFHVLFANNLTVSQFSYLQHASCRDLNSFCQLIKQPLFSFLEQIL